MLIFGLIVLASIIAVRVIESAIARLDNQNYNKLKSESGPTSLQFALESFRQEFLSAKESDWICVKHYSTNFKYSFYFEVSLSQRSLLIAIDRLHNLYVIKVEDDGSISNRYALKATDGLIKLLLPDLEAVKKAAVKLWDNHRKFRSALENRIRNEKRILEQHSRALIINGALEKGGHSDFIHDYIINREDFKRVSDKEMIYRKKHKSTLLRLFDNRCAQCGDDENGIDLDHFIFPKKDGGSFAMKNRGGYWVNNAIPLCERCNRVKGAKSYRDFFSEEKRRDILEKNKEMSKRLNEKDWLNS